MDDKNTVLRIRTSATRYACITIRVHPDAAIRRRKRGPARGNIVPTFDHEIDYDTRGRRTAERDLGESIQETLYQYDAAGNLVAQTDKNGRTTRYVYDMRSRLIRVIDPDSGMTEYRYDQRDNLVSLTDDEFNTTRFE